MKTKIFSVLSSLLILGITQNVLADDTSKDCYSNDKYVVYQQSLATSVGNNYLIWQRTSNVKPEQMCQTKPPEYMKITNGDNAFSAAYLDKGMLVLDDGTGTDLRNLHIYNLDNKAEVMKFQYYNEYKAQGDKINFWTVNKNAAVKSCPDYAKDIQNDLTPIIADEKTLNLMDLTISKTGKTKCGSMQ